MLGDSLYQVAFFWLAYKLASSVKEAGFVIFLASIPYLFFGLIGGVFADRWDRKKVMMIVDIIRSLLVVTVPVAYALGTLHLWHLAIVAFALTTARCFFYPSLKAATSDILEGEDRPIGVAFMHASGQAAKVLGLAVGGMALVKLPAPIVYSVPFVTFIIATACAWGLKGNWQVLQSGPAQNMLREVFQTVSEIRSKRDVFWSICLFSVGLAFIAGLDRVALPHLIEKNWKVSAENLGYLLSAFSMGNVISAMLIGTLKLKKLSMWISIGWALWGFFYTLIGFSPTVSIAIVLAAFAGVSEAIIDVPQILLIQTKVDRNQQGKVFSMWSTVAYIGESLSALLVGQFAGVIGYQQSYVYGGVAVILLGFFGLFISRPSLL
jgi:MFS family permease